LAEISRTSIKILRPLVSKRQSKKVKSEKGDKYSSDDCGSESDSGSDFVNEPSEEDTNLPSNSLSPPSLLLVLFQSIDTLAVIVE
jgi:hypothetical protein